MPEGIASGSTPRDPFGGIEGGIHEAARVTAAQDERRFPLAPSTPDGERFRPLRQGCPQATQRTGGGPLRRTEACQNCEVPRRAGAGNTEAPGLQSMFQLLDPVNRRPAQIRIGDDRHAPRGRGEDRVGQGARQPDRGSDDNARVFHNVRMFSEIWH